MEANMQVLEGAQCRVRVKLTNEAGEQLPPELFLVYAGAFCPGYAPAHFHAERTPEEWVLTMPGLKVGRVPWNWQVFAAEYATGVEWLLAAGEVTVTPRYAGCSGYVDPEEMDIVATLDKTTMQMTVQIGESTAACSLAVVDARNSAKAADASAKLAAGSASYAAEQAQAAETARKQADGSATNAAASAADAHGQATAADTSATNAANSASAAAASAKLASEHATEAAGCATAAAARAADAATSCQVAAGAASDALEARTAAGRAADIANVHRVAAQDAAADAVAAREGADAAATQAQADAAGAAASASAAAESATAIEGANETITNHDAHWAAWYRQQTDLTGFLEVTDDKYVLTEFNYDLTNLVTGTNLFTNNRKLKKFSGSLQSLAKGEQMFRYCLELKEFSTDSLDKLTSAAEFLYGTQIEEFNYNLPAVTSLWRSFGYTTLRAFRCGELSKLTSGIETFKGVRTLEIFDGTMPALSSASGMFNSCQLNKESALRVLGSIPAYESGAHPITVGIHVDNKTDEEVFAAIEEAKAKGWTVTTQWNGTATTSTFALRAAPQPPVYVKREQAADGEYEDASGTRYTVDWGHSVTSPHGEPEDLGYELFDSLEAALTEWGLELLKQEVAP